MNREKKNGERWYYIAIFAVVAVYLIASFFLNVDTFSKRITTVTVLISAVAFWLQFRRKERLNESEFIMNLNEQFIGNRDMTFIEHELEQYYNQYEILFGDQASVSHRDTAQIHLGISQSRTGDDCQKLINYLVYLESLAALVGRGVIHLGVIDDLFSYRFFIAVNNPVVQEDELYPYADFYRGIFALSERWTADHKKRHIPIPMVQFSLSEDGLAAWKARRYTAFLEVSFARASDSRSDIAGILYDTDPYIYPAAFGADRKNAVRIISRLIELEGSLLDARNLLIARYNGEISGVCLLSDGSGTWDPDAIISEIGSELPSVARFRDASEAYFCTLRHDPEPKKLELVACCVEEGFRRRHIASAMLKKLLDTYPDTEIELTVLCENKGAIRLYEAMGFADQGEAFPGFAAKGLAKPMCRKMIHPPGNAHFFVAAHKQSFT